MLVLLTLALAVAAPTAAAVPPVAPAGPVTGEVEAAECTGDGAVRLAARRSLPARAAVLAHPAHPAPRTRPSTPAARTAPPRAPPSRTTVLRC